MHAIVEKAAELKCYKMSLESLDAHLSFYEEFGFKVDKENEMAIRHIQFKDNTETRFDDYNGQLSTDVHTWRHYLNKALLIPVSCQSEK